MTTPPPNDRPDAPLLVVDQLAKTFHTGGGIWGRARPPVRAVDGVSFTLKPGETLGLVGETGSGKSTIGRLVLRLIEPTSGDVTFAGQNLTHLSLGEVRRLRAQLQMVFQDPYGSLDPRMTVGALIAEPMIVHGTSRTEIPDRVRDIMSLVGLDVRMAERYPHEFSGGQRQRIGIARAMALQPKLLVLDEPVSALDVSIQAQILNLLREIQGRTGVAYLFIAHDLAVVRHISHRVAVLYLGRIVEIADRDQLYRNPQHPYTVSLLSAVPIPDPVRERTRTRIPLYGEISSGTAVPSGCRFHPRCFRARLVAAAGKVATAPLGKAKVPQRCMSDDPALTDRESGHRAACHFSAADEGATTPTSAEASP